ncbi:MAG: NAD-dependent epimerase/dehydratase family protein [Candidatus Nanopelagicales bacterium]
MRILITGSAGFIGSHILEAMVSAGHDVVGVDRLPSGSSPTAAKVTVGDIADTALLSQVLPGVDVVCHQAAKVGLGVDAQDLPDYVRQNDLATAVLVAAMDRHNVRHLVLASSMVVYGEGRYDCPTHGLVAAAPRRLEDLVARQFDPRCPSCDEFLLPGTLDEDSAFDPRNAYAATKVAQEHLSASWARQTGGRVTALRYHNVYGPRMPRDTPYAGVASIFRSAIANGNSPQVFEDGRQRRDFVHVRDVARANLLAAESMIDQVAEPGSTRAYNVASGEVRTIHDLAKALTHQLNGPAAEVTGEFRLGDVRHITANASRIYDELGWTSSVDFAEGVAELARD